MSEVVFRGVKYPANCADCFFWPICPCLEDFDDYYAILDAVHDGDLVRHEECPVSQIPEGHGDLIDREALMKKGIELDWSVQRWVQEVDIFTAPTIVPAEGGTE
jgi:hypothetical protein